MKHLILAAFGTTTAARETYDRIDGALRPFFADCQIHWTYTSPTVRRKLSGQKGDDEGSLTNLLLRLNQNSQNSIVIQSVHVTPGHEFHRIVRQSVVSVVPTAIGMPLLTAPADYQRVAHVLLPLIHSSPDSAVLILGHGTDHPSWTAYPALESVLRKCAGKRLFVGTLEKFPDSSSVIDEITADGYQHVLVVPCLMVAGMHFKRDIIGDTDSSWKKRFENKNISLTFHDQGLGMLKGISDILCDHIRTAFSTLEPSCPVKL
jgi:sirohydrochlorin cobaltochelatase